MRNSYEVRAQKFIREFFPFIDGCVDFLDYEEATYDFMIEHPHRKVAFDHGMTRVVFITSDYVVKMDYSEENIEKFGGGEKEIAFYEMAEREGMAYLFAKISRYDYEGVSFYIMPRVYGIGRFFYDADEYLTAEESDWCWDHVRDLHNENYGWKNGHVIIFDYAARA